MYKSIKENKVCFVLENLEEAKSLITALSNLVPFYTEYNGETYEIKNIDNVSITIILNAEVNKMNHSEY